MYIIGLRQNDHGETWATLALTSSE